MKISSKTLKIFPLLLLVLNLQTGNSNDGNNVPCFIDAVGTAMASPEENILVVNLKAAIRNLLNVLKRSGSFRVLAMSTAAFDETIVLTPTSNSHPCFIVQVII